MVEEVVGKCEVKRRKKNGKEILVESGVGDDVDGDVEVLIFLLTNQSLERSRKRARSPAGAVTIQTSTFPPLTKLVPTRSTNVTAIRIE